MKWNETTEKKWKLFYLSLRYNTDIDMKYEYLLLLWSFAHRCHHIPLYSNTPCQLHPYLVSYLTSQGMITDSILKEKMAECLGYNGNGVIVVGFDQRADTLVSPCTIVWSRSNFCFALYLFQSSWSVTVLLFRVLTSKSYLIITLRRSLSILLDFTYVTATNRRTISRGRDAV